jgi:uncharacterized protein (TIGR02246 family)
VETSLMLYVDAASVDMRRAAREMRGATSRDATLATSDKGRAVMDALVAAVLADIDTLRRTPLPAASAASAPAGSGPELTAPRGPAAPRRCTPGDERAIREIGDAFTLHWSNADAEKLAALWSPEGDIIHPDSSIERGREVIRSNRAALFTRPEYRGSKHPLTLTMIRCVDAEIAIADGKWELRGLADEKGKLLPTFEGQCTVFTKRGENGWLIEAYRYTQKPAAAPMPTLLKRPGFPGGE